MPITASELLKEFRQLSKEISGEFPEQAARALVSHFQKYETHLSHDGEVVSRTEYMDLLQESADRTGCFLGVSRQTAEELLRGKFPRRYWLREKDWRIGLKLFFLYLLPVVGSAYIIGSKLYNHPALQDPPHLPGVIGTIVFLLGIVWLIYVYRDKSPKTSLTHEDYQIICRRFLEYNRKLSQRPQANYPALRLFVLEREKIRADDRRISWRDRMTWWQLMVEEHKRRGIAIGRIPLAPSLEGEHPQVGKQFSLFIIPGEGGWVIVLNQNQLPQTVLISFKGREVYATYGTLCRALQGIAECYTTNDDGELVKDEYKMPDFSKCLACDEDVKDCCDFHPDSCAPSA